MAPDEAQRAARVKFGGIAIAKEDARAVWVPRGLQDLSQDLRLALRSLRAAPLVTAAAILSLTLGAGGWTSWCV